MPILPHEWRSRLKKIGLTAEYIDVLMEAEVEDERFSYLPLIEENLGNTELAKTLANWFVNVEIPLRREGKASEELKDASRYEILLSVYELAEAGKLSSTSAKSLITQLLSDGVVPKNIEKFAEEQGYIQLSDTSELEKIIEKVIKENKQAAEDVKNGEMKAIGFLVGQVMKKSLGKANPGVVQQLLKKKLG